MVAASRARSLVLAATAAGAAAGAAWEGLRSANRSPGCNLQLPAYAPGYREVAVGAASRRFQLFLPSRYEHASESPLWLLAPGAYETAERFLYVSGMLHWAEKQNIAFAALESARIEGLNVGLHSREVVGMPDDVGYTRDILRDVSHKLCIDMDRIRCVGYSRGARFCSRLASELSSFVKGIAPVGGVRYPAPNNATWPMPIVAIHGTSDRINPYWGVGDPSYWNTSVPVAVNSWSRFNGCKFNKWVRLHKHVVLHEHFDCRDDASVVLVMVEGGGHTWPGSSAFEVKQFGPTTQEVSANEVIEQFFMKHPRKSTCHIARKGEGCYEAVKSAMAEGLAAHPEWAPRIRPDSGFGDYQAFLHAEVLADCPRSCKEGSAASEPSLFRYV